MADEQIKQPIQQVPAKRKMSSLEFCLIVAKFGSFILAAIILVYIMNYKTLLETNPCHLCEKDVGMVCSYPGIYAPDIDYSKINLSIEKISEREIKNGTGNNT
jgi:hypothetical protein